MADEKNIIKVGILCSGKILFSWQLKMIQELLRVEGMQLFLLLTQPSHLSNQKPFGKRRFSTFLFHTYKKIARKKMQSMKKIDASHILQKIPCISCVSILRKGLFQSFPKESIRKIKKHGLDGILQLTPYVLKGEILDACPYGVWTFYHDHLQRYGDESACFWEIYGDEIVTRTGLYRLTPKRNRGILLQEGFFSTIKDSYTRHKDRIYFLCADWPARVCRDISNQKANYLEKEAVKMVAHDYRPPTNIQMMRFWVKIIKNKFIRQWKRICLSETWNVGIVNAPIHTFLVKSSKNLKVHWLPKPLKGTFIADPFGIKEQNKLSLMIEELDYEIGEGKISALEGIQITKEQVFFDKMQIRHSVIEFWAHLSYPYLIQHEGEIYCIPEAHKAREVALYKAETYPTKWEKLCVIVEGSAIVDATAIQHDGYWWLFGINHDMHSNSKLYLWYAKDLLGPWKEHPANPVKNDVRSSRPAGTPFVYHGRLYRPAQDCSQVYGGRIAINRVSKLTTTEFEEEVVLFISSYEDSPYPHGIHTISSVGDKTIIDSKKVTFDLHHFKKRSKRYLRKRALLMLGREQDLKTKS